MDIYNYLMKDHHKVSGLMEQVCTASNPEARGDLYRTIRQELTLHAETEEKTFYRALKKAGGKQLQEKEGHAEEEHKKIRAFLKELDRVDCREDAWLIAFGGLKHMVEHHVEEEEGEIFAKAKKVLSVSQAEALAGEMDALKQKKLSQQAA